MTSGDNPRTLHKRAIALLRAGERDEGRQTLKRALKADPENADGWVLLAHIEGDRERKRQYLQRALKLNPENARARQMLDALQSPDSSDQENGAADSKGGVTSGGGTLRRLDKGSSKRAESDKKLAKGQGEKDKQQITRHLREAKRLAGQDDHEGAVAEWVRSLRLQPDHPTALWRAVDTLESLGYPEDSLELLGNAIANGSQDPDVYERAIKYAHDTGNFKQVDSLREKLLKLPTITNRLIIQIATDYEHERGPEAGISLLQKAIKTRPESQHLLIALGDLYQNRDETTSALVYYNRAAQLGRNEQLEQRLADVPPILTDRERRSMALAWREAGAVGLFYLLLAWQDAGLDLMQMTLGHWTGLLLSVPGAYLLVTATSSPQQVPLASKLGGQQPAKDPTATLHARGLGGALEESTSLPMLPPGIRIAFAVLGIAMLGGALLLTFGKSIGLFMDTVGI